MGSKKPEGLSDEDWDLGNKVKALRDEGTAWWQIARDLDLPGAGDSATTGKSGAAKARGFYKKAHGDFPRTFRRNPNGIGMEKNEHVKKAALTKKADRVAAVKKGKHGIKGFKKMDEEQLEHMLVGRKITWIISTQDGELHETARIHSKGFKVLNFPKGRGIEFREAEEKSKIGGVRGMPSRYRNVLLANIHTVK